MDAIISMTYGFLDQFVDQLGQNVDQIVVNRYRNGGNVTPLPY